MNAGEWWKSDIKEVASEFMRRGGDPNISDAYLVNGQPGDLYNCSKAGIVLTRHSSFYDIRINF